VCVCVCVCVCVRVCVCVTLTEAWNGTERIRVARAMGESSSVQSEKLRSLACSLSEMGLDNGNPPGSVKQPTTVQP
jgi:hypothetical protein